MNNPEFNQLKWDLESLKVFLKASKTKEEKKKIKKDITDIKRTIYFFFD